MIRRVTVAVPLAAALCLALALPTSALATENLPKFGKCFAQTGGKYKNSGCTKLAKAGEEKFEWEPLGIAVKFTGAKEKETGNAVLESASGTEISCTGQANNGEYGAGNLEKNVIGEFTGCKALGAGCQSGGTAEHVNTNKLHGEPGIIVKQPVKEEKNVDGVDLRAESGENLAEFKCGPAPITVRGGIVAKWQTPGSTGTTGLETNKMLNKVKIGYIAEKPGKQVPSEWIPNGEGVTNSKHEPTIEHLEASIAGGAYENSGFSLITSQVNSPKTTKIELRQCEKTIVC
jgi:hypothetical protein